MQIFNYMDFLRIPTNYKKMTPKYIVLRKIIKVVLYQKYFNKLIFKLLPT